MREDAKSLFCKYRTTSSISLTDFLSLGLSREDYQNYLTLSTATYAASIVCISDFPNRDKLGSTSSAMDYTIAHHALTGVFNWLSNITGEEYGVHASYSIFLSSMVRNQDEDFPYALSNIVSYIPWQYVSFEDFRISLENIIRSILLDIPITIGKTSKYTEDVDNFAEWESESNLHRHGYRVGRNGLSTEERKALLSRLIDGEILSKGEIEKTILASLRIHKNRDGYIDAVRAWEKDLAFLCEYTCVK